MKLFNDSCNWYKGNLHTHTTVSDGRRTPEEAIETYRAHGYDFLALTDHRKLSLPRMDGNMLLTGGVEFDYMLKDQCIHIVGIGLNAEPQLEPHMCGACAQDAIDAINAQGGLAILAHPTWSLNTLEETLPLSGLSAMEIYNSVSGVPWNAARADASHFADLTYTRGKYTPVVASDDTHFYTGEEARSFTYVNAPSLTLESIKAALRAGRMYASQGPRIYQIEVDEERVIVDCDACSRAIFFSNSPWVTDRCKQGDRPQTHFEYTFSKSDTYVRVQLEDAQGRKAWSGAIVRGA